MTDQSLFPAPVTTTDHLEGVVAGKSGASGTIHDQTYGSLPTPQEIKNLLAGLSGKQIGSSGQELISGVDYWKNSTGIEDLKNKISFPVNTGSSDLKLSNNKLHVVSLVATGAGGESGIEAENPEYVSAQGHFPGGGFIGGTSGGGTGNTEPVEHIHVNGRRYLTVHGLNAEEINGKIFLRGPNGGLLTEKNNDGSYSSQPMEIIEKDLKQITQDIYGRDPTDDDYRSYNNLLQNSKSPQEARGNFSHSPEADNRLKAAISDIQGRNATEEDRPWLNAQEDALGNGQTSLKDIYKGTAAWTADHGGYDQIFEQIHGRAPTAQDRSYAATRIGDGWSVQTYRWNEAHSDDTKSTLSRIIEQVQDRQVTPGDSTWITGQQDDIGSSKQNMNDIRPALAKWSADHGAYDDVFKQVHGRSPSQEDRNYAAARIGNNWSVQDYRWNEAHSDNVSIQLTKILSDSYLNKDVNIINDEIIKIQNDIGSNKITFDRASFLIKLGADLSTISNNTQPGNYTPVNSHKPGSYIYTSGSGKQFWVTSEYSFKDIVNNAKLSPPQIEYEAFYHAIKSAVGHGGLYDAQRNSVTHVLYSENIDNANYNVGVWCAAYGMPEFEMNFLGDIYINKTAKNAAAAAATEARDLPLWHEGYKDYSTGYIK